MSVILIKILGGFLAILGTYLIFIALIKLDESEIEFRKRMRRENYERE